MKTILIAGNWKSNKNTIEAKKWLQSFKSQIPNPNDQWEHMSFVLFVPFTTLYLVKQEIIRLKIPIQLGAQDVSPYAEGAHTGEESAHMLKELATWVLVGHSERRKDFHENDVELAEEVKQAKTVGLSVMYCVSEETMQVPTGVDAIAYEPTWAIGTGKTENPEHANEVLRKLLETTGVAFGLYGGSITAENVGLFLAQTSISGVLVGGASLDPQSFANIIKAATSLS